MVKFNVLQTNQKLMYHFGIYSNRLTDPTNEFFKSVVAYYMVLFAIIFYFISTSMFVSENLETNFAVALETILAIIGGFQFLGMYINTGIHNNMIKMLHLKLQAIVDDGKKVFVFAKKQSGMIHSSSSLRKFRFFILFVSVADEGISAIYWKNEQKCRQFTSGMISIVFFQQTTFFGSFVYSIYCVWNGDYDTSKWILLFNLIVSFETSTLWGWYLIWFIQVNMAVIYVLGMITTTSYFVCSCFYIEAICDHFAQLLHSTSNVIKRNKSQRNLKTREKLFHAIKIHAKIFE